MSENKVRYTYRLSSDGVPIKKFQKKDSTFATIIASHKGRNKGLLHGSLKGNTFHIKQVTGVSETKKKLKQKLRQSLPSSVTVHSDQKLSSQQAMQQNVYKKLFQKK